MNDFAEWTDHIPGQVYLFGEQCADCSLRFDGAKCPAGRATCKRLDEVVHQDRKAR